MHRSLKAAILLFLATGLWGASYPVMKALGDAQGDVAAAAGTWYVTSLSILIRFGVSAAILAAVANRRLLSITRLEWGQSIGLGLFGGVGLLFQMDGVQHTAASTSAFLTQCYCIFIPITLALHRRRLPGFWLAVSCIAAISGVAILSNIDWHSLRLGRGEWESIFGSLLFTGQILWLERPIYKPNRCSVTTCLMFAITTLIALPVFLLTHPAGQAWFAAYNTSSALGLVLFLTFGGTLATYTIMNYWQPHVPATQAGLIYCCEPLFTSVMALFLPAWLSLWCHINYANEQVTHQLLLGGGLITAANLLALWATLQPSAPLPAADRAVS